MSIQKINSNTLADGAALNSVSGGVNFRNRIINGDMRIDQRNAGSASSNSVTGYWIDRWRVDQSTTGKLIVQQNAGSVTPPAGFTNYFGATSQSAYAGSSGDIYAFNQYIEGFNTSDFAWGGASASAVTLSFWVRSSLTGTQGGAIQNEGRTRSYPFTYTINSANTWEYKTVTIAGDQSGTWATGNGIGVRVFFNLGTGSSFSGTPGSWAGADYRGATGCVSVVGTSGATFYITGVQLEAGSVATPFERRPYGTELQLCQRYFEVLTADSSRVVALHYYYSAGNYWVYWYLKATKRAAATVTRVSGNWTNATPIIYSGVDNIAFNASAAAYGNCTSGVVFLTASAEL